eukprot:TRINITY_DN7751_c0_g1_i2.p1 TRINITY_DN7751_c0_g1~~TRINITY_DN7751_c0_g1_i2.p1  ORF type:complete len:955 (+),score=186.11 TRINITY_DN7751_c0_g1_i2:78-2867(+)
MSLRAMLMQWPQAAPFSASSPSSSSRAAAAEPQSPSHPASVDIVAPRLLVNGGCAVPGSPSMSSLASSPTRYMGSVSSGAPPSPVRPPLESSWLQRMEACAARQAAWDLPVHQQPLTRACSKRRPKEVTRCYSAPSVGATASTSGGSSCSPAGFAGERRPKADSALQQKREQCDRLEEEVLAMMSILQKPSREMPQSVVERQRGADDELRALDARRTEILQLMGDVREGARQKTPSAPSRPFSALQRQAAQLSSATGRAPRTAAPTVKGSASGAMASQSSSRAFSPPLRTAERALRRVNSAASGFGAESGAAAAEAAYSAAATSRGGAPGWQGSLRARARQSPVASELLSRISSATLSSARKAEPRQRQGGGAGTAGARNRTGINSSLDVGLAPTPPKDSSAVCSEARWLARNLQQASQSPRRRTRSTTPPREVQAQDARHERVEGLQRSEDLEAFVEKLQSQLEEATARALILEREIASVQNCNASSPALSEEASVQNCNASSPALSEEAVSGRDAAGDHAQGSGVEDDFEHRDARDQETDGGVTARRHRDFSLGDLQPVGQEEEEEEERQCEHFWEFVVQGQLPADETCDTARKISTCFPSNAMERVAACKIACVCVRGHRLDASVPNQDDFLLAMCSWGVQGRVALYGVFDGHGSAGHRCAAMARGFLPERIFGDPALLSSPEEVLRTAFREAQEEMLRREPQATLNSGTTATVALVLEEGSSEPSGHGNNESELSSALQPGTFVYTAHVGDSRAILAIRGDDDGGSGSTGTFTVTALTQDHRPDVLSEAERIRQAGGEVRPHGTAGKQARVMCPQPGHPGFALTRSLGLASGLECGIISEPQVSSHHVRPDAEALLVLGTDGLFEFCSGKAVAGHLFMHGVTEASLGEVVQESRKLWSVNSSNSTVDDTTALAVSLGQDLQARRR